MKEKIKWILEKAKEQPAALKIMEMIVTIITTLIIFSGNMISCHSNRTTQVEKKSNRRKESADRPNTSL